MNVSYHHAKFGGHSHSGSRDIMLLVCHVNSDQVIKGSLNFMGGEPLVINHHFAKFRGHKHCGSGDINIPVNTVILPLIWDIHDCICQVTFIIIIFCKAQVMSGVTRVSKSNLKNSFYGNFWKCVQWNKSNLGHTLAN